MTKDEIIEMARQAGAWETDTGELVTDDLNLEAFAKLATAKERDRIASEARDIIKRSEARGAAKEREACAKLFPQPHMEYFGQYIQDAIRARGEQA